MSKLYSLKNINLTYPIYDSVTSERKYIHALKNMSLDINKNEFLAIVGANGSGKTSLGKFLTGLANTYSGELYYKDRLVKEYKRDVFCDVSMVIQEPQNQLLMPTVKKELEYPLKNRKWSSGSIAGKIAEYAEMFSLVEILDKSPDQLSGGQITAVALASILITDPEVVILDEPDSHFDKDSKKVLSKFIRDYRNKKTIIFITQYMNEVKAADRAIVLKKGTVVNHEKDLKSSVTFGENGKNKIFYRGDAPTDNNIMELKNISYAYGTDKNVLSEINLTINGNERIGIIGEMGSGKTTLGLIIAGLIKPCHGSIVLDGIPIQSYDEIKLRRRISYSMQFPERALFEETVYKDIATGPNNLNLIKADFQVNKNIQAFKIDHIKNRHPFTLSGGEKRRAALAGILAMDTDIIVLDEPTSALDQEAISEFTKLLCLLKSKTIIIISHDIDFIAANCNRIIGLNRGRIILDQSSKEFFVSNK